MIEAFQLSFLRQRIRIQSRYVECDLSKAFIELGLRKFECDLCHLDPPCTLATGFERVIVRGAILLLANGLDYPAGRAKELHCGSRPRSSLS